MIQLHGRAVSDAARTRLALVTRSDGGSRRISRGAVALGPRERAHSCRGRCVASDLYASDSYASDLRASHLQRQICMGCALFFFVPSSSSLLLPAPPPSSSFGQRRVLPLRCAPTPLAPRCPCNCMWLQAATIAETSAPSVWGAVCWVVAAHRSRVCGNPTPVLVPSASQTLGFRPSGLRGAFAQNTLIGGPAGAR